MKTEISTLTICFPHHQYLNQSLSSFSFLHTQPRTRASPRLALAMRVAVAHLSYLRFLLRVGLRHPTSTLQCVSRSRGNVPHPKLIVPLLLLAGLSFLSLPPLRATVVTISFAVLGVAPPIGLMEHPKRHTQVRPLVPSL